MKKLLSSIPALITMGMNLHTVSPKTPTKAFRKVSGCVPYSVHPVGVACIILEDNAVKLEDRIIPAIAALFHDVLEDTTVSESALLGLLSTKLPKDVAMGSMEIIKQCTFDGSSLEECRALRADMKAGNTYEETIYVKLVDKYWNLMGSSEYFIKNDKLIGYLEYLDFLIQANKVSNYKDSMIINSSINLLVDTVTDNIEYIKTQKDGEAFVNYMINMYLNADDSCNEQQEQDEQPMQDSVITEESKIEKCRQCAKRGLEILSSGSTEHLDELKDITKSLNENLPTDAPDEIKQLLVTANEAIEVLEQQKDMLVAMGINPDDMKQFESHDDAEPVAEPKAEPKRQVIIGTSPEDVLKQVNEFLVQKGEEPVASIDELRKKPCVGDVSETKSNLDVAINSPEFMVLLPKIYRAQMIGNKEVINQQEKNELMGIDTLIGAFMKAKVAPSWDSLDRKQQSALFSEVLDTFFKTQCIN